METVKAAVGLGKKEGEEPVNGETGEGTTAAPFDSGNSQEAQEAAKKGPEQQDSTEAAPAENTSSTSGGGGWLKSVNPFSGGKKEESKNADTAAGAEQSKAPVQQGEDDSKLPPNHIGANVPQGHSLDFAPPQPEQATAEKKKMAENDANPSIASASTDAKDSGFGQSGQLSPDWQGKSASGPSKTQQLRGSRASMSAPSGTRIFNPAGQNPGRIPTAGGKVVGAAAAEDRRRRSVWSSTDEGNMPPLDKQGSPDPVTQNNTMANTVPQSSNGEGSSKMAETMPQSSNGEGSSKTAEQQSFAPVEPHAPADNEPKPNFQTFAWGEGGEGAATATGAEEKTATTGGTQDTAATAADTDASKETDAVNGNKSSTAQKAEEVKEKVKEAVPTPSSGGANKERRASRFDAFKGKLGLGSKKA